MTKAIQRLKATAPKKPVTAAKKNKPQPLIEGKWYLFDKDAGAISGPFDSKKEADAEKKYHLENIDDSPGLSVRQAKKGETAAPAKKPAAAMPKDVQAIVADYDDVDGVVQGLKSALKAFGITVNEFDSGSDAICLALSKTKLSKAQLKELFNDE